MNDLDDSSGLTGIWLAFRAGQKPDADSIRELVGDSASLSISFDPALQSEIPKDVGTDWVELLCDGLTFELSRLSIQSSQGFPALRQLAEQSELICLAPGAHLAGGENSMPIFRTMMALAASLCDALPGAVGIYWPPSDMFTDAGAFIGAIDGWLDGGAFPVSQFIALFPAEDGMKSKGLTFFTGQELLIERGVNVDPDMLKRLGNRLLGQLVLQGRIEKPDRITGPDGGLLSLSLSADHKLISIRSG